MKILYEFLGIVILCVVLVGAIKVVTGIASKPSTKEDVKNE